LGRVGNTKGQGGRDTCVDEGGKKKSRPGRVGKNSSDYAIGEEKGVNIYQKEREGG